MSKQESLAKTDIRLTGALSGLNPFRACNSASRVAMDASHLSQAVVLNTPDRMDISSGMDYEYAKYTFDIRFNGEEDEYVKVIKILKKYSRTGGDTTVENNSVTYVIYENLNTNEIDVAIIPKYYFSHTYFGFQYRFTREFERMREGDVFPAQTKLAIPPSINNDEEVYAYGLETLCAFGSFKEVFEDGIGVSESYAKRMSTQSYGTMTINYGKENYLLNLYGDENNYKPFPDIGQKIRDDGLLFALRKLDHMTSPVKMTPKALMEIDPIFDQLMYGLSGATVVDITVQHSHDPSQWHLPTDMGGQPARYFHNNNKFYRDLDKIFYRLKGQRGETLKLSPQLHALIVNGLKQDHDRLKRSNKVTYRREELEEFRVTITYTREEPLQIGAKLAATHGDKGVITAIIPDELMPRDKYGRVCDAIFDDNQTFIV